MLKSVVSTALKLRVVVIALSILLIVYGIQVAQRTPVDVFPEFAPPLVEVQTEAPGLSTEEVESLVTVPLENGLNGVPWLKTLRSKSVLGLSSIVLIFAEGTDLLRVRQLVQERLAVEASRLPAVAKPPVMLSPLSSLSRVLKIGITSKILSQMDLTELAKWTIRPRLLAVPGVAHLAIWGQRDKQFQVLVDPDRLNRHGVTLDAVLEATKEAAAVAAGGFIDTPNQRLAVRHLGAISAAEDLAGAVIELREGSPIRLGDVADVQVGFPAPIGDAVINDVPGLLLIVEKQPWANTVEVTRNVEKALDAMRPSLHDVEMDATIFRPATFVERSLRNLEEAVLIGCALVAVVLIAFLFNWRTAAISLVAIPLSVLAALVVLFHRGDTINTMVLAGLVIAVGEVVDDAIIDVENIVRRLKLNQEQPHPESAFAIVLKASLEVRSAVVFASLIVVLVFVPVMFLEGTAGAFFRPLAFAYVLAILASLAVALTVTPALALLLLPSDRKATSDPPLTRALKRLYRAMLPAFVKRPAWAMVLLGGIFSFSAIAATRLGEEFLPDFQETDFLMHWVEKPGTSLEAMQRITMRVSKELRAIPGVRNFGSHIGRAEVADEVVGPNFTELWISLDPNVDYSATVEKIQSVVDGYPGLYRDLLTYLRERVKEVLTGTHAAVVVRVYGSELSELRAKALEISGVLEDVQGVVNLTVEQQSLVPQVQVEVRAESASRLGLSPADVKRAVALMVMGTKVGEVYEQQRIFDVTVWGVENVRRDLGSLCEIPIATPGGGHVLLGDVAKVEIVPAPNEIKRESASRRIDVTCNVKGRDLGGVVRDIEARIRGVSFQRGYYAEVLGEYAARAESQKRLLLFAGLALIGIVLLLYVDFQSIRLTLLVFLTLPFALVGGVFGAMIGGGVLSLGSLVGFVTVLGIAARNGIMLISHYRHLEEIEGEPFGSALVLRGAEERLTPIVMTALCTALALVPLALAGNRPGYEVEYPMAIVILGGLVTSTLLNLFFVPALYAKFGGASAKDKDQ